MVEERIPGGAVLLIPAEPDEIPSFAGPIAAVVDGAGADVGKLGLLMVGPGGRADAAK